MINVAKHPTFYVMRAFHEKSGACHQWSHQSRKGCDTLRYDEVQMVGHNTKCKQPRVRHFERIRDDVADRIANAIAREELSSESNSRRQMERGTWQIGP